MTFKSIDSTVTVSPTAPQSLQMLGGSGSSRILWANAPARYAEKGASWGGNHTAYPFFAKHGVGKGGKKEYTFRSDANVTISVTSTTAPSGSPHQFLRDKVRWDFSGGTFDIQILSADSPDNPGDGFDEIQRLHLRVSSGRGNGEHRPELPDRL